MFRRWCIFSSRCTFCKESAKFLPILTPFGYFNAILRIFGLLCTGLQSVMVCQILQISGMFAQILFPSLVPEPPQLANATWIQHFWTAVFQGLRTCPPSLSPVTKHLAPWFLVLGARCRHLAPCTSWKPGRWGIPENGYPNVLMECVIQVASALQSKVMARTWFRQLHPMHSAYF